MFGLFLFIIFLIIVIVGFTYLVNKKNNDTDNFLINELNSLKKFKTKALTHLNNSFLEIDFLNNKYLGSEGGNSVCYKDKDKIADNCECHPSCKTCGYSDNPIGMNQCLTCKNGTDVNKLYENGAGWCSSYQLGDKNDDFNTETKEKEEKKEEKKAEEKSEGDDKITMCLNKFQEICPTSSEWKECLERNNQSLVLSGCQMQLKDDGSISAKYAPVKPKYKPSGTSGGGSSGGTSSGSAKKPLVTKSQLKYGDTLTHNEHLISSNSKHYLYITMGGSMYVKNKQTGAKIVIHEEKVGGINNAPYTLILKKENEIVLSGRNKKTIWSVKPVGTISGPNTKLYVSDMGKAIFKDNNENIRWSSEKSKTGDSQEKKPYQYTFDEPVFGVMKFSKCPLEYPFQAKKDRLGAGLACSKTKDVEVTKSNSCAVKGHFRGAGNAILPRCYPDQVAKDPSGKYMKCPPQPGFKGAPDINKYVLISSKKCLQRKGNKNKYRKKISTVDVTGSFKDI